jgi:hypothetical protein
MVAIKAAIKLLTVNTQHETRVIWAGVGIGLVLTPLFLSFSMVISKEKK